MLTTMSSVLFTAETQIDRIKARGGGGGGGGGMRGLETETDERRLR
jgi:hypothetical protein